MQAWMRGDVNAGFPNRFETVCNLWSRAESRLARSVQREKAAALFWPGLKNREEQCLVNARGGDNAQNALDSFPRNRYVYIRERDILTAYRIQPSEPSTRNRESRGVNICLGRSNIGGEIGHGLESLFGPPSEYVNTRGENAKFSALVLGFKKLFPFSRRGKERCQLRPGEKMLEQW